MKDAENPTEPEARALRKIFKKVEQDKLEKQPGKIYTGDKILVRTDLKRIWLSVETVDGETAIRAPLSRKILKQLKSDFEFITSAYSGNARHTYGEKISIFNKK